MITGYSSLFSSGLLANREPLPRAGSPPPSLSIIAPSTPPRIPSSSTFPPGAGLQVPAKIYVNTKVTPRTSRRRKSSLTAGASPLGHIKSPMRSVEASFSRAVAMSPTRNRVMDFGGQVQNQSLFSMLKNGDFRGALAKGRRLHVRKPQKAPPTMPLPALPDVPQLSSAFEFSPQSAPALDNAGMNTHFFPQAIEKVDGKDKPKRPVVRRILTDTSVNMNRRPSIMSAPVMPSSGIGLFSPAPALLSPDCSALGPSAPSPLSDSSPVEGRHPFDPYLAGIDEEMHD